MKLLYEHEEASFEQQINESTGEKKYKIKGIFSSPGKQNKNGRIYPMNLWESEVQKYQDVIKNGLPNSLMELEHPPRSNVDMMEAVAKIEKLWLENGYVMGEAVLLNNPKANQLKTLIDAGIKMSVSSRGLGSVKNGLVESYKLITFDVISNLGQSDFQAEMYGIVEGVLQDKEFLITESGEIKELQVSKEEKLKRDLKNLSESERKELNKEILNKFKNILNEVTKSQLYTDYKTKETDGYKFRATFSKINKMSNKRELEDLWFKSKMDALGHADKYKKELEAGKQF